MKNGALKRPPVAFGEHLNRSLGLAGYSAGSASCQDIGSEFNLFTTAYGYFVGLQNETTERASLIGSSVQSASGASKAARSR